ncbi:hypothetical protein Acid345_0700 [Candidatus Koribacter versatilis Ellin345]|uniref:Uncharacterized protein n=1 Tax=Koribacter versatilis (strain Ellin345) TaxID=204669 RepID=Q1ITU5_KORVE|nr:hypothetical protein [Candidatus Koribacter versatilis]ABF39705.1 hypothetical protein Acid345_0700 [Candidatus Koribacter versatilis Ellin345]
MNRLLQLAALSFALLSVAYAQEADQHDMANMSDDGMSMHEMHMSAHMRMTTLRSPASGDQQRADAIALAAKNVMSRYTDYRRAEADGFKPFHPEFKQPMYHFTNGSYAIEAQFKFNPDHPTSLLYEPTKDGYRLVGVMYTAPFRFTEDQLNQRAPLSIAQWHMHTNLCIPPWNGWSDITGAHPKFGLNGSISDEKACTAAGGTFRDHVFGWMVHVYPNEADQSQIWSVERQMSHTH